MLSIPSIGVTYSMLGREVVMTATIGEPNIIDMTEVYFVIAVSCLFLFTMILFTEFRKDEQIKE